MKSGDREQDDVELRWLRAYRAKPRVLTEVGIKLPRYRLLSRVKSDWGVIKRPRAPVMREQAARIPFINTPFHPSPY